MTIVTGSFRGFRHGFAAFAASASVLILAIGFYGYAASLGNRGIGPVYELDATFLSSSGLQSGADVVLAGVTVGTVTAITLDEATMSSHVRFQIEQELRLPVDTRLSIGSSTLTSGNALLIRPGKSTQMVSSGATLTNTCELVSLEQQISQYIFGNGGTSTDCGS